MHSIVKDYLKQKGVQKFVEISLELGELVFLTKEVLKNVTGARIKFLNLEFNEYGDDDEPITSVMLEVKTVDTKDILKFKPILGECCDIEAGIHTFETENWLPLLFGKTLEPLEDIYLKINQTVPRTYSIFINIEKLKETETEVNLHVYLKGIISEKEAHDLLKKALGEMPFQICNVKNSEK